MSAASVARKQKKLAKKLGKKNRKDIKKSQQLSQATVQAAQEKDLAVREQAVGQVQAGNTAAQANYTNALTDANAKLDQNIGLYDTAGTNATNALRSGVDAAKGELQGGFNQAKGYLEPYNQTGIDASEEMAKLQGLRGPQEQEAARQRFQTDPGYQFRLEQGIKALDKSATARGGVYSGSAMRDVNDYAQGQASQEYGNYYNRFSGLADRGVQAGGQLAELANKMGINMAELEAKYGAGAADIIMQVAQQKGGVFAAQAGNIMQTGQQQGFGNLNTGFNSGTITAGGGQDVGQLGLGLSGNLVDYSGQRTTSYGNQLNGQMTALGNLGNAQAAQQAASGQNSLLSNGLQLAGTVGGALLGGPGGASAGSTLGSLFGKLFA